MAAPRPIHELVCWFLADCHNKPAFLVEEDAPLHQPSYWVAVCTTHLDECSDTVRATAVPWR